MHGLRPPGRGGRIDLGGAEALVLGPPPDRARRIVLALHGRGAEAGTIARRFPAIAAHDPDTCVLGLRAHDHAERWYAIRAIEPGAARDPEVVRAIARVDAAGAPARDESTHARRSCCRFLAGRVPRARVRRAPRRPGSPR